MPTKEEIIINSLSEAKVNDEPEGLLHLSVVYHAMEEYAHQEALKAWKANEKRIVEYLKAEGDDEAESFEGKKVVTEHFETYWKERETK